MILAAIMTAGAGALLAVVGRVQLLALVSCVLFAVVAATGTFLWIDPWAACLSAFELIGALQLGYVAGLTSLLFVLPVTAPSSGGNADK